MRKRLESNGIRLRIRYLKPPTMDVLNFIAFMADEVWKNPAFEQLCVCNPLISHERNFRLENFSTASTLAITGAQNAECGGRADMSRGGRNSLQLRPLRLPRA